MIEAARRTMPGVEGFLASSRFKDIGIGLVTNPSGVTSRGVPTWRALLDAGFRLSGLFGPEHGFRGDSQDGVKIADQTFRGVPVYSLYGAHQAPTTEMARGMELMLFDIQDVGCRYYTYLYTLASCIGFCAAAGVPLCVLDRPNPIGAIAVEGGPIHPSAESFVGGYGLPARYGMTIGEYARYLRGEYYPTVELEVVELAHYRRDLTFEATGLPWVSPSPNVPSVATAVAYPGTCLFEGTSLSEGRGTTRPFETIGAPWIDGERLREALMELGLPGVAFSSTFFTPSFSKHKGESCEGVVVHVLDRAVFRPLYTALAVLWVLKRDYPEPALWDIGGPYHLDKLAGGGYLRDMLEAGAPIEELYARACREQARFEAIRERYLIYR